MQIMQKATLFPLGRESYLYGWQELGHLSGNTADLLGQLKGRRKADTLRMPSGRVQSLEHGQQKGGCLAGATLALGNDVSGPIV
jgi:hypothetical protein